MAVCQSGQPIPDSTFCSRFIESVRMMACVICSSCWEASHRIACVCASTSMVRLEVVTLWAPLFSCTGLPPCLTQTGPLRLSHPRRSRCHVSCCWLWQAFVLLHWLFEQVIRGSACLGSLTAKSRSRAWSGRFFPVPYLHELCKTAQSLFLFISPVSNCSTGVVCKNDSYSYVLVFCFCRFLAVWKRHIYCFLSSSHTRV